MGFGPDRYHPRHHDRADTTAEGLLLQRTVQRSSDEIRFVSLSTKGGQKTPLSLSHRVCRVSSTVIMINATSPTTNQTTHHTHTESYFFCRSRNRCFLLALKNHLLNGLALRSSHALLSLLPEGHVSIAHNIGGGCTRETHTHTYALTTFTPALY